MCGLLVTPAVKLPIHDHQMVQPKRKGEKKKQMLKQ